MSTWTKIETALNGVLLLLVLALTLLMIVAPAWLVQQFKEMLSWF